MEEGRIQAGCCCGSETSEVIMMSEKPFRLVEYFGMARVKRNVSNDGWEIDTLTTDGQYTQVLDNNTSAAFLFTTSLDLGGFTREDLTAFFAAQGLQRPNPYIAQGNTSPTLGGAIMDDVVIITDVPLEVDTTTFTSAGFPSDVSDFMTIKFAEGARHVQSTTTPNSMVQADSWGFGSGEPTAAAKLYCYRFISMQKDATAILPSDLCLWPEVRYVASGLTTNEPEFVYLNRLRRSGV